MKVNARLDLNRDRIRARLDKFGNVPFRFHNHQMNVQGQPCRPADSFCDRQTEGDIRHKPPIHHVDVDKINSCALDGRNLFTQIKQVGAEDRRPNPDRVICQWNVLCSWFFGRGPIVSSLYPTPTPPRDQVVMNLRISPTGQIAVGSALNGISWAVAWAGPEPYRFHTFFPLWLGFIIAIDGVTRWTTGTSLMQRLGFRFILLFLMSIPIWWVFEIANIRLQNWMYILPRDYSWIRYHAEASLAFSTVAPAIFVTAELIRSTVFNGPARWIRIAPSSRLLLAIGAFGAVMFTATMIWPNRFFPMVWISLFLAVDAIVRLIGGRSISESVAHGRWEGVLALFAGTLICGFFWELWNFWSMPRWTYQIAYADWLRIFEMPVLGFGGYLPFGLEVFAFVSLADRLLGTSLMAAVRIDRSDPIS
jgi:hypothetical protein